MSSLLTDLKAYYNLEGNGNDISGNGNNATSSNITYGISFGKIQQGGSFDGSLPSQLIKDASSMLTGNNSTSMSGWVQLITNTGNFPCPITLGNLSGTNSSFAFYIDPSDNIILGTFTSNIGGANIGGGGWHHCCATYDGTTVTFYVDGVNTGSANITMNWLNSNIHIGYLNTDNNNITLQQFTGNIDEVGYWQRCLTPSEVSTLYNNGMGLTYPFSTSLLTTLVSYYACEGNGNDSLGTNNATPVGVTFSLANGIVQQGAGIAVGSTMNTTTTTGFPSGVGTRTTTVWIKTVSTNVMVFMPYGQDIGPPNQDWAWVIISGQIWLGLGGGGSVSTTTVVNDGLWHFLVATYDGTNVQIFVDNLLVKTQAIVANTVPTTLKFQAFQFDGSIDEVGFWTRVLTTGELTQLYNGGLGLTYPFSPPFNASFLLNLL